MLRCDIAAGDLDPGPAGEVVTVPSRGSRHLDRLVDLQVFIFPEGRGSVVLEPVDVCLDLSVLLDILRFQLDSIGVFACLDQVFLRDHIAIFVRDLRVVGKDIKCLAGIDLYA